ncbi:general secretion pathway protein GspB [Cellvibrio sp. pealriver]|uniref:general secretion pathway protein GspB n=1 Tax=Cellvibrio sp. pealriver TaxID=1622269 RepID=UPI00066FBF19|nr:general secretion pathway protein GspB [Cellvibrio sp. pealriver]
MSLILDALNRAESERKNQNAVPDISTLHTPHELARISASKGYKWALIVAVLIVFLSFIAAALWWFKRSDASLTSTQTEPVAVIEPTVATISVNEQHVSQLPAPTKDALSSVQNQSIAAGSVTTTQSTITTSTPAVANANAGAAVSADVNQLYEAPEVAAPGIDADINELYAAESSTGSASVVDPFAAEENISSVVAAETEPDLPPRTFASITNIPDFNALPWNMRQSIPTITYLRHNFLANGVSSVVINNQTAGVGNIISVGQFVVQEIYVDGVVLKHGNTQFKLRALNGWINM